MGSNILDILHEIAEAKGAQKKKVLEDHKENSCLKELWLLCYGRTNLHTRKVVEPKSGASCLDFEKVVTLLKTLQSKKYSGNAQKDYILTELAELHPDCVEVYNRVITGNLKCGIGAKVANKIWGKSFLKEYPVMLISPYCPKKAAKILESDCAYLQEKSDGVRGITEVAWTDDGYTFKAFSRQGEEFLSLSEKFLQKHCEFFIHLYLLQDMKCFVDGEFCVIDENGKHDPSKASGILNKAIKGTATDEEIDSLTYVVWDTYLEETVLGENDEDLYTDRLSDLKKSVNFYNDQRIRLARTWDVATLQDISEIFQKILEEGNEGVVLKSGENTWKDSHAGSRATDCIKYKEKHQAEFRIKSTYLGKQGNEFQNVIGGFHIESEDGKIVSDMGSGLSLEDRGVLAGGLDKKGKPIYLKDDNGFYIPIADFESFREEYIDQIVTGEYNKRTKDDSDRETFSLRFPILKQFRNDKDIANTLEEIIKQEESTLGIRI